MRLLSYLGASRFYQLLDDARAAADAQQQNEQCDARLR
jgi:hypothetical protein